MQCKGLAGFAVALCLSGCGASDEPSKPAATVGAPALNGMAGMGAAGSTLIPRSGSGGSSSLTGGLHPMGTGGAPAAAMGTGGVKAPGTGGMHAGTGGIAMMGGTGGKAPDGMAAPAGDMDPVVPALTADCPEFTNGTITFMGLGGIDIVAGAKPAGPTAPMVFYWHGTGSFSGEYAGMAADVYQGVVSEGGVLVSFQDTTGGDLLSGTAIFGMSDFALTDQLFACAVKNHNVDPRQVFATGCSAGGLFSDAMAAERSSYMAAAASNSGGWTVPLQFENSHTPSLMTVHGAPGVDVVGIDFSDSSKTADTAFKAKGAFVINCNHGGGHCGGGGLAPEIWQFFKAHPFGVSPEPWASGLPAGFSSQCMIFQ
jgi:hypothetical protein